MSKRTFTIGLVVAAVLVAAGGLFASNMGFKLNYQMLAGSDPNSADGTNALGLPFNRQSGLNDAQGLINDIGSAIVQNVQRYNESTGVVEVYTGTSGVNFPLTTGEGYLAKLTSNTNYIVVGSHDPSFGVDLDSGAEPDSFDGTNFYSYAYHSTVTDAQGLINDIGSSSVQNVQRYNRQTGIVEVYTGTSGTNFPLVPGEAYLVKMTSTVNYVPSHY